MFSFAKSYIDNIFFELKLKFDRDISLAKIYTDRKSI